MTPLAPTMEAFFTDRLLCQQRVSPNTIGSYRDTFRLLLGFAQKHTRTPPAQLELTQLDASMIGAFLEHLETDRGNSPRTRNVRLGAVHAFFNYCALRHPEHAVLIARVLAIPTKRSKKRIVTFLTPEEVKALLNSPDRSTRAGRRDHALLLTAVQTGLRVSELIGLTNADVHLGTGPHLRTFGKGRKQRIAPLTSQTVAALKMWTRERGGRPTDPLFPTRTGTPLSRDAIERRLAKHVSSAEPPCPTLRSKRVSMHVLRHTAAMMLLAAGVDTSTIALWLGHDKSARRTSICTPTWRSNSARLTVSHPPTGAQDATGHPTPYSRSSKTSDAIMPTSTAAITPICGRFQIKIGMTARSALR